MNASRLLLMVMALCMATVSVFSTAPLTFEERVKAQEAIEQVYYAHRIWPKENPGPKPPFEEMVPNVVIEAKVTDYLKKCVVLDKYWQRPIKPEELQAEMDRMVIGSKNPATLQELFAALNDDPYLIAECIARPLLADRIYADHVVSSEEFEHGASELSPRNDENAEDYEFLAAKEGLPSRDYSLNSPPSPEAFCEGNWAGTSMGTNCPTARTYHTAVWTGAEMIVWGGLTGAGIYTNTGGRYYPSTDTWIATSTGTNCPVARYDHTAIWTGLEMIVWGGTTSYLNTGGRYNPSTDTWTATSTGENCPKARTRHVAVWTGIGMIVWGGQGGDNTGGRYYPATDSWLPTSTGANCPSSRYWFPGIWTGTEMIVWGGYPFTSTGGRYNPTTDTWLATSNGANRPSARDFHTAVWTGTEMIVWGGRTGSSTSTKTGGRYNPSTDTWVTTSTGPTCPEVRYWHTAIWTGTEMIVWGGEGITGAIGTGGRYNTLTDTWMATSTWSSIVASTYVWTGTEMIIWGGMPGGSGYTKGGGRYTPPTIPSPVILADATGCTFPGVVLSTETYSSYQWYKDGSLISGATEPTYIAIQSGTYSVIVVGASGCTGTSPGFNLTVFANPTPTVVGSFSGCSSPGVSLSTQTFSNYQWLKDGTDVTGASEQSFVATASGSYSVRVADSNGCTATSPGLAVTAYPNPSPTVVGNSSGCSNPGVIISTQGYAAYQWVKDGTDLEGATNRNFTATVSGLYTVRVTDTHGCEGTAPVKLVTISANPQPTVTGSATGCVSPGVVLSTQTASSYIWYKDDVVISGATSQGYTATVSAIYTVKVTDANGCQGTSPGFAVTVYPNPVPTITGTSAACANPGTTLTTGSFISYQWAKNGTPISGATAQTLLVTESGTYTVTVVDENGCEGTSQGFTFTAWNPLPTITGPNPACVSATLSTQSFSSYQWYRNGTLISGAVAQSYFAPTTGNYTVQVTDSHGCTATSPPFVVSPNPVPVVSGAAAGCPSVVLSTTAPFSTYQWQSQGADIPGATGATYEAFTSGSYSVRVTDGSGCPGTSATKPVSICVCALTCSASASPTTGQAPLAVTFSATATPTYCTGPVTYAWTFGDGGTSTQQNPSHTYAAVGSYNWNMTATVQGVPCSKSGTVVVSSVPVCSLTCTASAAPTSGQAPLAVTFTSTATPSNCTGSVSYAWIFGDGATSTQQNPSHTYSAAGSYNWTMTATVDGVNCIQNGTVTVSGVCALTCTAEVTPTSGQAPLEVTFGATATPSDCQGEVGVAWTFGDGGSSVQATGSHTYASPGTYGWTMTATVDGVPCSKSGSVMVTETPSCSVVCTATAPASAPQGTPVSFASTVTPTNCAGSPTYAWTFGDGGTSPLQNPKHTYSAAGSFDWSLTVTVDGITCTQPGAITIAGACSLTCAGSATPSTGYAPLAVSFTGTATPSQCSDTPTFFWDFGDGQNASAPSASHTYTQPGTYAWTLVVTADGVTCIQEGAVTATANPNPSLLTVGGGSAAPGGTVTVPVTLAGKGASLCSLTTDISYEPSVLTFSGALIGPAASDAGKELNASTPSAGLLRLGWLGFNATPMGDGDVAYVTFTVAPAAAGSTTLNHACGASDCEGGAWAMSCPGGLITFTSGIPGDCDSNGSVSIGEVQRAINMFLGTQAPGCGADCSGDGTVSIGEVQKVVNAFLGLAASC